MQDEQFMREWNARPGQFSADFDRGLRQVLQPLLRLARTRKTIGGSYGRTGQAGIRTDHTPVKRARLRGRAFGAITLVLWLTVIALATPAPGFASAADATAPRLPIVLA